jgi:hypothetical protein
MSSTQNLRRSKLEIVAETAGFSMAAKRLKEYFTGDIDIIKDVVGNDQ